MGFQVGDFVAFDPRPEVHARTASSTRATSTTRRAAPRCWRRPRLWSSSGAPRCRSTATCCSPSPKRSARARRRSCTATWPRWSRSTTPRPAPGQNSRERGVTIAMADSTGPFDYHLTHKLLGAAAGIRHRAPARRLQVLPLRRGGGARGGQRPAHGAGLLRGGRFARLRAHASRRLASLAELLASTCRASRRSTATATSWARSRASRSSPNSRPPSCALRRRKTISDLEGPSPRMAHKSAANRPFRLARSLHYG